MTVSVAVTPHPYEPPNIPIEKLRSWALIAAASLAGFGLILYIAANWDDLGRFGRFGLVGGVILAGGLAAIVRPSLTIPGLLFGFAAVGGMLALIGQTYQTGADAWQLFALWAGLTVPWVLAARSDALWTPWAIVAMTAVALWQQTQGAFDTWWLDAAGQFDPAGLFLGIPTTTLIGWSCALAVAALISPLPLLDGWLGHRRWAFRVALVLVLILIGYDTISAVFAWPRVPVAAYFAGLAFLAGVCVALVTLIKMDMLLLAASALAFDSVLVVGLARLILPNRFGDGAAAFLAVGVCAAVLVAASVVGIMRLSAHSNGATAKATNSRAEDTVDRSHAAASATRPWPVVWLSGLGAMPAAVPFIIAVVLLLGNALSKGAAVYVLALLVLPASFFVLRGARSLFVEQLATIGLASGLALLSIGLFRDLSLGMAGVGLGVAALALAFTLGRSWIGALLGAVATCGFAIALIAMLPGAHYLKGSPTYAFAWSMIALAGFGAALIVRSNNAWLQPLGDAGTLDATLAGWLGAALAGLAFSAGSTFLAGAHVGGGGAWASSEPQATIVLARGLSALLTAGGCAWLVREVPTLRTPLALAMMLIAAALSIAIPALGATVLLFALAVVTRRRVILIASVVAAVWIVGAFYTTLSLPLAQKAAILAGAGTALGIAVWISGGRLPTGVLPASLVTTAAPSSMPLASRGLALLGLVAAGALSVEAVHSKEALIRDGSPVFLALAPVDPRSLMQGDYMALRFELPGDLRRQRPAAGGPTRAIGLRDGDRVLRLSRVGDAATPLAPGEMMIELVRKRRQWIVVTDAWFFKEGTGDKWQAARFGEFRVMPGGRALLVGLADKDRIPIK